MNNDVYLKPCPFCGGKAKLKLGMPYQQKPDRKQAFVQCTSCHMIDPVEQDCIWAYDVEALDNAIERMGGERRMSDLKIWLISGVIALAAIAVSVMYACMVVSGHKRKLRRWRKNRDAAIIAGARYRGTLTSAGLVTRS